MAVILVDSGQATVDGEPNACLAAALVSRVPFHSRLHRLKHPFYHINIVQLLNENAANSVALHA
jgi:hypothetical protein